MKERDHSFEDNLNTFSYLINSNDAWNETITLRYKIQVVEGIYESFKRVKQFKMIRNGIDEVVIL